MTACSDVAGVTIRCSIVAARSLVIGIKVAVITVQIAAVSVLVGDHGLASVPDLARSEPRAPGIEFIADAVAGKHFNTVQVAAWYQVDDTCDGVGPIDSGCTVGYHVNPGYTQCWHNGRISGPGVIHYPVSINQHQRGIGANTVDIGRIEVGNVS